MSNSSLIERIRKILSRTTEAGCTAAEAESAYKMATRLLAEANLTMGDVTASADGEAPGTAWESGEATSFGRWTLDISLAYGITTRFCFVQGWQRASGNGREKRLFFFGKAENVETARFMFTSLHGAFDRLWQAHRRDTRCPASDRRAFIVGVSRGFQDKMNEEREVLEAERDITSGTTGGTALALRNVMEETQLAYRAAFPSHKGGKVSTMAPVRGSQSAMQSGYQAGRNLNLNRSIAGKGNKAIG